MKPAERFIAALALLDAVFPVVVEVVAVADDRAYIEAIQIPAEFRGRGHGRELLHQVLQWADRCGVALDLQPEEGCGAAFSVESWYARYGFSWARDEGEGINVMRRHPRSAIS